MLEFLRAHVGIIGQIDIFCCWLFALDAEFGGGRRRLGVGGLGPSPYGSAAMSVPDDAAASRAPPAPRSPVPMPRLVRTDESGPGGAGNEPKAVGQEIQTIFDSRLGDLVHGATDTPGAARGWGGLGGDGASWLRERAQNPGVGYPPAFSSSEIGDDLCAAAVKQEGRNREVVRAQVLRPVAEC